ncbi:MAG TPA: ATP phosphoribosyltransferase regulatory subunit, partial [Crinalium sp.]
QTFDYYTGIVFEAISGGAAGQRVLSQGGRYDQLLGLYHPQGKTFPGVGFTINIDELHQVLLPSGQLPLETPMSNWLVVPTSTSAYAAAFTYADKIRASTNLVRVEVDLGGQDSPESVRSYARLRSIGQIAWVNEHGIPEIESLN